VSKRDDFRPLMRQLREAVGLEPKILTSLELAEEIARAVLETVDGEEPQAVLRVLHDLGYWFCRVEETPQGTMKLELPKDSGLH
jgi:hypothetical protein